MSVLSKISNFFKKNNYSQSSPAQEVVFINEESSTLYKESLKDVNILTLENSRIVAAQEQLTTIFTHYQINPHSYSWADCWTGSGLWSLALSSLLKKTVLAVDLDFPYNLEPSFETDSLIEALKLNTSEEPLPPEINAVFLRSSLSASSMIKLIKLNPNLELLVLVPEGMNCYPDPVVFQQNLDLYQEHFSKIESEVLTTAFGLRGSTSGRIIINKKIPTIVCRQRKKK